MVVFVFLTDLQSQLESRKAVQKSFPKFPEVPGRFGHSYFIATHVICEKIKDDQRTKMEFQNNFRNSPPMLKYVFDSPNFINLKESEVRSQVEEFFKFANARLTECFIVRFSMKQDPNHFSASDLIDMFRNHPPNVRFFDKDVEWYMKKTRR